MPGPVPTAIPRPAVGRSSQASGGSSPSSASGTPATVIGGARGASPRDVLAAQSQAGNAAVASQLGGGAPTEASLPARVLAAIQEFADHDPKQVKKVAGDWLEAKTGDGKDKVRNAGKLGKVTTTHEAGVGAGVGAYGGASAGKVDLGRLGEAYEVLAEAGFVVGAELKLSGSVQKELGPVAIKAAAALKGFAGVYARGEASGYIAKGEKWWEWGGGAAVKGEAFAGAKADGEASVSFEYDDFGAEGFVEGAAMAGAEASAEGEVAIDLAAKRIAIGGEVSVLAGVKASGTVGGKAKLYGRDAFTGKVTGEVSAGAGGSATIGFKLNRGVLTIDLGGAATAGVGGGVTTNLITDFKPIAVFVWRKISQAGDAIPGDRSLSGAALTGDESKLRKDLRKYRDSKLALLRAGRADNFVKIEKVQAYIDWHIARHRLRTAKDTSLDDTIKTMVETECSSPSDGLLLVADVQYGYLKKLELTDDDALDTFTNGTVDSKGNYSTKPTVGKSKRDLRTVGS